MTVNAIANSMQTAAQRIASGRRINSAADDAAGLAIIQGMEAQIRGLDQGYNNTRDMQNLLYTADGAFNNIGDGLNRIRELSIQAANGINTQADRERIQTEINSILDHIEATTSGTEFNTMPLLDGSFQNANTASSPDGTGMQVSIADMGDLAQAITQYNVANGTADLNDLDAVMEGVASERASLGAGINRLDYTADYNAIASANLSQAQSRIGDADIAEEIIKLSQAQALNEARILMQQQEQENANQSIAPLLAPNI